MLFQGYLLSLLIWLPILGGVILFWMERGGKSVRWIALLFSVATLALCIPLYMAFDANDWHMQWTEHHQWIPGLNLGDDLGVDGLSVLFIMLTCFTNLILVLSSWNSVRAKANQAFGIFLISAGISNGIFAATEAILFYFFWEASMIPMYLGLGLWGGKERAQAALKFFLFTFAGSIFLLLAFLYLHVKTHSFGIGDFQNASLTQLSKQAEDWLFLAFLIAFAVKIPMWPLHTWMPDAHRESPSGGSVILGALMLKMGAYGFLRFSLPIAPMVNMSLIWLVVILSLIAIVYVGLASVAQKDLKQLVAYSSVSHMGIVVLGLFATLLILFKTSDTAMALISLQGAVFQMIAHAFSSGALLIGMGYLAERFHSRFIKDYQGLAHAMPIFAAFFMLFSMANVGLPGTSGFVGEFLVILAAFKTSIWVALLAALTLIIAPAYTLWMYKKVLFGEERTSLKSTDLDPMEIFVFVLLAIPVVVFGIYPEPILNLSHAAMAHLVQTISL